MSFSSTRAVDVHGVQVVGGGQFRAGVTYWPLVGCSPAMVPVPGERMARLGWPPATGDLEPAEHLVSRTCEPLAADHSVRLPLSGQRC